MADRLLVLATLLAGSLAAPLDLKLDWARRLERLHIDALQPEPNEAAGLLEEESLPAFMSGSDCNENCTEAIWKSSVFNWRADSNFTCGIRIQHRARKEFGTDGAGQILACAAVAEKFDECLPCLPHISENDPLRFAPNPPPASPPTPVVPPLVSPDTEPPISPSPPPNPAPSDYSIRVLLESSMCLDVKHGSMEAGSTLLLWECTDRPASNQQFYYDTSDSTIRVKDKPELCVNAHGGGLASKDIVGLWTCSADVNEQWTLPGDGTIRVKSKPTLCINADGGYVKGTDIILYECTSPPSANEQWQSVTIQ